MLDVSVFVGCVTEETLQRFFTHTLMRVLTHRPVYKGELSSCSVLVLGASE